MALPTTAELELLQLINRFRADPAGEYARLITSASPPTAVLSSITGAITFFNVDLALLAQQLISFIVTIFRVADYRIARCLAVHSNLVRTARNGLHIKQAIVFNLPFNFV